MKKQLIHLSLRVFTLSPFLCNKFRQLEAGYSNAINWKTPSVQFLFDSAKVPDHHLILSLNRPQFIVVISSVLIPMDTTFLSILLLSYLIRCW